MSCAECELCEQPPTWEHSTVDGVFIKQMYLKQARTLIPQHAHAYDHVTMLAHGKVRLWSEETLVGDFEAPRPIFIPAQIKHTFMSLTDDTLLYCIHNTSRTGSVQIVEEHQFSADSIARHLRERR